MGIKKFNAVQGFSVGDDTIFDVIDSAANVTANNLTVNGTTHLGAIANVSITGGTNGYVLRTDGLGGLSWENPADVGVVGSNTQIQFNDGGLFGASANLTFNKTTKTLTVDNIIANGVGITNMNGANISGTVADSNYAAFAGNITISAQPNITSVGTLVRANITGNISSGNANLGYITTSQLFTGTLTTADQPNITSVGTLVDTTMGPLNSLTGANLVSASYLTGTLTTKIQPNITSLGTLAQLRVTANITSGNVIGGNLVSASYLSGDGYLIANLDGSQVTGIVANANYAAFSGNVVTRAQPNITSVGTLVNTTMGASNSLTGGNLVSATYLTGTLTTDAQPNITSVGTLTNTTLGGANSLTGGNLVSANYIAGTLTTKDQSNITSVGTLNGLNIVGDTSITGNLTVTGAVEIANVSTFKVKDPIIEQGGKTDGTALTTNDNFDRGQILHYYTTSPVDAFMGWDNSNAEFAFGSNVTVSSEQVTFNQFGNVRANYFLGNASQLVGTISSANYAAYAGNVTIAAQPNITSVGTLINTTMGAANSLTGGNLVSANYLTGTLTTNAQPNITSVGTLVDTTMGSSNSLSGGNLVSATYLTGTLTTKVQPNITSVGTLVNTTLGASNSLTGGNLLSANYVTGTLTTSAQPNITSVGTLVDTTIGAANSLTGGNLVSANYFTGTLTTKVQPNITSVGTLVNTTMGAANSLSGGNLVSATYLTGTLTTNAQPNITSVGTLEDTTMGGSNSLSGGNLVSATYLTGTLTTKVQPNITSVGTLVNTTMGSANSLSGGNLVSATYLTGTLTTTAQPNISSVGTLANLNVSGNITAGGNIFATANISSANANLGYMATASYFSGVLDNLSGTQPNITSIGTLINTSMGAGNSLTGGNLVSASYLTGTLTTKVQPNITSVGTLVNTTMGGANSLTGGNLVSANYFTGTLTTGAQPNITSVGTLDDIVLGSANSFTGGNLVSATYLTGTLTTKVQPNITSVGTLVNTTMGSSNSLSGGNLVSATYLTGTLTTTVQPNISSVGTLTSLNVSGNITSGDTIFATANVTAANANLGNLVTANYFTGTLTTGAQPNITSVGTLVNTTMGASNSLSGGNLVSASYLTGTLTTKVQPNITSVGTLVDTTMGSSNSLTGGNLVSATYLTGTLTTTVQPNISSVGTLTSLNVSGNITSGNNVIVTANVSANNANLGNLVTANYFTGTLTTGAQPNITSVGTLVDTVMGASNSLSGGNLVSATYLTGTLTTKVQPNITSVGTLVDTTMGGANSLTGGNLVSANYFTGTLTTNAQPNITSVGTLSGLTVVGSTSITGNLTVTGSVEIANVSTFKVKDPIIEQGGKTDGTALTTNDNFDRGQLLHYYSGAAIDAFMGWDNSNAEFAFGSNVTVTGEIVEFNEFGNVRANYFFGNGSQLTGVIPSSNYAGYAGNVTLGAQPNITSVGTLVNTTMGSSNSLTGGNLVSATYLTGTLTTKVQPNITSIGTLIDTTMGASNSLSGGNLVSATYLTGTITTEAQPNITSVGTLVNTTMGSSNSLSGGNLVSATYLTGTLTTKVQPNITGVGTLASLNVTGNITSGNNVIVTANVSASNANLGNLVTANYFTGTLTTNAQPNITSVGTLVDTTMGSSNSLSGGNLVSATYLTGTLTTKVQPNITSVGTLVNTTMGSANSLSGGNLVSATYITGTLTTNAQPNITSVGTLVDTVLGESNSFTGGNLVSANYFTGTLTTNAQPNITSVGTLVNTTMGSSNSLSGGNLVSATYLTGTLTTKVQPNITSVGSLSGLTVSNATGVIDFTNTANVSLGSVSNIHISGGTSGYVLKTDGSGTLSWVNPADVGVVGSNTQVQFNDNGQFGASANFTFNKSSGTLSVTGQVKRNDMSLTAFASATSPPSNPIPGDEWYDQLNDIIYKYIFDGTSSFWVDTTSGYLTANTQASANSLVQRDANGNVSANFFIGDGSQLTGVGSSGGVSNGTSNVTAGILNGNITVGIAGVANTVVFTTTGMNVIASGGINAGNTVTANYILGNGYYLTGLPATYANSNVASYLPTYTGDITGAKITLTGNITSINANLGNLVTANYFSGSGNLLSNIQGANVTGQVANALVATTAATVTTNAQPNITSVGTLTSLNVTGNITSGNTVIVTANISSGNANLGNLVTANYFSGNGSLLTGLNGSNITSQVANALVATTAGTVTTNAQPNITSVGTLSGLTVNGNLTISGTFEYANVTSYRVKDPIIEQGGNTDGTALTSNDGYDRGQILHYYSGTAKDAFMGWDNSNAEFAFGSNVSVSSEVVTFNSFGNVRANYFLGNASQLVGTIANANYAAYTGNVVNAAQSNITSVGTLSTLAIAATGSVSGANLVSANYFTGTLTTNAQPNITSVGTLSSLTVTANVTGGNANLGNLVTANYFTGNGSLLTGLNGSNITSQVANANYATYAGNVINAIQSNITSVGTLASLAVTANANVGNLNATTNVKANGIQIVGSAGDEGGELFLAKPQTSTSIAGTGVTIDIYQNKLRIFEEGGTARGGFFDITALAAGVGTDFLTGGSSGYANSNVAAYLPTYTGDITGAKLTLTGNVTSINANLGNLVTANYFSGAGNLLSNIQGGNVTGQVANALVATTAGTVTTNAQPNITSVGTLSTVNVTGNATASYFIGNGSQLTGLPAAYANANVAAYLPTYTGNITGNIVTLTGNVTAINANLGNLVTANYFSGSGNLLSNIQGANVTGTVANATYAVSAGSATTAGTVTTAAQPNITSVGTLVSLAAGDATITGNLVVSGTTITANVTTINVKDPIIEMGGNTSGAALTSNDGKDRGTLLHYYSGAAIDAYMGWDNSNAEFAFGSNVSVASEVVTFNTFGNIRAGNANLGNLVSANYFSGAGNLLSNIQGGNVTGQVANALVATTAGTVTTNAQPNITSVGTLSTVNVTGNVTASYFIGNGSQLTGLPATYANSNVASYLPTYTGNITGNIVTLTGNVTAINANLGNLVTANYFTGNGSLLTGITATGANYANYAGNVTIADQPNITSVGTLANLNVSSNITTGVGTGGSITGANLVSANYFTGTLTTNAQPNITSVGTLNGLTSSGVVNFIGSSNVSLGSNANVHITGGTSGQYLQTDGSGNLSWGTIATAALSNGTSNVSIPLVNGNVIIGSGGNTTMTVTSTGANITGYVTSTGNVTAPYFIGNGSQLTGLPAAYANSNVASYLPTYTGELSPGNITSSGNVTATYFIGNGSQLTGLPATYANSNVASYLPTYTGELSPGNITSSGNVTASYFIGAGNLLSNIVGGNVTGQVANALVATTAGTVTTNAQPNITSVGTLTGLVVSGDTTITGNVTVSGAFEYANVTTFRVQDPIIEQGGNTTGSALSSNDGYDRGQLLHYYSGTAKDAFMGWDNSNAEFAFGSNVSVASEVVTFNSFGNVRANYFLGNASQLVGTIANANYAAYAGNVVNAAQSNITSVGSLSSLTVTGLITATAGGIKVGNIQDPSGTNTIGLASGNVTMLNSLNVGTGGSGNVTATYFIGNGSQLTGLPATYANSNVASYLPTYTGNITGNIITLTGNVTAINANLGNLVTANYFTGSGNLLSNIVGGNVTGQVSNALIAGNVYNPAQANITSVGTLSGLTVDGVTNLGAVSNVRISGGSSGYVLTTNGSGSVSWQAAASGSGMTGFVSIVKDIFTGDGTTDTFSLSTTPSSVESLVVNIDGLVQQSSVYSLSTSSIVFTTAPYVGQQIEVTTYGTTGAGTDTQVLFNSGGTVTGSNNFAFDGSNNVLNVSSVATDSVKSKRANVAVTTNTVIDEFPLATYRSAKYYVSAKGTDGYQSTEVLLVQDGTNSYVTIYGSICSNTTADIVEFSSNIASGNVKLYATTGSASTTVNLIPIYITD